MATRSIIGKLNPDNTISFIYCHFDGYPSGVGQTLCENYKTETYVDELLKLGDLSILGQYLGEQQNFSDPVSGFCLAYGRDRGEVDIEAETVEHDEFFKHDLRGEDYKYLFVEGVWLCFDHNGNLVKSLSAEPAQN
jgi:hypothetical protein